MPQRRDTIVIGKIRFAPAARRRRTITLMPCRRHSENGLEQGRPAEAVHVVHIDRVVLSKALTTSTWPRSQAGINAVPPKRL